MYVVCYLVRKGHYYRPVVDGQDMSYLKLYISNHTYYVNTVASKANIVASSTVIKYIVCRKYVRCYNGPHSLSFTFCPSHPPSLSAMPSHIILGFKAVFQTLTGVLWISICFSCGRPGGQLSAGT